jgi:hypothetical protein
MHCHSVPLSSPTYPRKWPKTTPTATTKAHPLPHPPRPLSPPLPPNYHRRPPPLRRLLRAIRASLAAAVRAQDAPIHTRALPMAPAVRQVRHRSSRARSRIRTETVPQRPRRRRLAAAGFRALRLAPPLRPRPPPRVPIPSTRARRPHRALAAGAANTNPPPPRPPRRNRLWPTAVSLAHRRPHHRQRRRPYRVPPAAHEPGAARAMPPLGRPRLTRSN